MFKECLQAFLGKFGARPVQAATQAGLVTLEGRAGGGCTARGNTCSLLCSTDRLASWEAAPRSKTNCKIFTDPQTLIFGA